MPKVRVADQLPPAARPFVPEPLQQFSSRVAGGDKNACTDTRSLLKWFGYERRTPYAVALIRLALAQTNLVTVPDFESAYIDGPIQFVEAPEEAPPNGVRGSSGEPGVTFGTVAATDDPTFRLGKLQSANLTPVSVRPDDELSAAVTIMMARDFSQLPVLTGERTVKGVVTWGSIGSKLALTKDCQRVRDCYDSPPDILSVDTSLFIAVEHIARRDFVLVKEATGRISGIVTAADVAEIFRDLGEPFLLLGEIENYLRRLIDSRLSPSQLQGAMDPSDANRQVASAANLTFGEYIRLLENPTNWQTLSVKVSRSVFLEDLERIRNIRNDVMHFDPDGLAPSELKTLRTFVQFLRNLASCGVM